MNRIIKITKIKNINIKNNHNGVIFKPSNILKIYFESGEVHIIDLYADADITGLDYIDVIYPDKYKEKIIFSDFRGQEIYS